MARRTDGASTSARPGRRPHDEKNIVGEVLRHRHVDLHEILGLVGPPLDLSRHAHDLAHDRFRLRRRGRPQRHSLADRGPAGETAREGFVHDAHRNAVARIAAVEGASGQDRQIECREIRRADDLILGARPLALVDRRIADDLERVAAVIEEIERQRARPGDARDARNGGNLGLDLIVELLQRFGGRVLRAQRIDEHREHALRAIAAIECFDGDQRPQQEPRAKQQKHGGRDLADDEQPAKPSAAARHRAAAGPDDFRRREVRRFPRRHHAEEQPDQQRRAGTERDDARVERERDRRGQQTLRNERGRRRSGSPRRRQFPSRRRSARARRFRSAAAG